MNLCYIHHMSNFPVFYYPTPSSKQKVAGLVLFVLLFIQLSVAMGGCLVSGYLPPMQQAEKAMQMEVAGNPCANLSSADKQPCMQHCEHSSDTPKLDTHLPFFATVALLNTLPLFMVADAVNFETTPLSPVNTAPPIYLRFLRLLN